MIPKTWIYTSIAVLLVGLFSWLLMSRYRQFILGGFFLNIGFFLQDRGERYDFVHDKDISPEDIWKELHRQNELAYKVRKNFHRADFHPIVGIVTCMDSRLRASEIFGDTRHYYYIIRTAGSVMSLREVEMLELAVANGIKLILLTTHTDCAAEKMANDAERKKEFPNLTQGLLERESRIQEFLERPKIKAKIQEGSLVVKRVLIETHGEKVILKEQ